MSLEHNTDIWLERYKRYLQSDEWKEKREKIMVFWDFKCALCFSPRGLQVHHRTYARVGNERLQDLILLCNRCHGKFHETLGHEAGPGQPLSISDAIDLWTNMNGFDR